MGKEPKNDTSAASTPLAHLTPLYIDFKQYGATIVLGIERPSVDELYRVETPLRDLLPALSDHGGFKPELTPQGHVIQLLMSNADFGSGFNAPAKQKLSDLVQPKYRARGAVLIAIKRVDGRHTGTVVTVKVTNGRARPRTLDQITAIKGVLRASRDSEGNLMFSPSDPAKAHKVAAAVTDTLGLYCPPPTVEDDNPLLALLPEYDYRGTDTTS